MILFSHESDRVACEIVVASLFGSPTSLIEVHAVSSSLLVLDHLKIICR